MLFTRKPFLTVTVDGDGRQSRRAIPGDSFLIGSDPACDLQLQSPMIAQKHLALQRTADGWVARVEGLNSVVINEQPLQNRDRTIHSDDLIKLAGGVSLLFTDPAEEKRRAAVGRRDAATGEPTGGRRSPVVPILFAVTMVACVAAAALLMFQKPDNGVDMTVISPASIGLAVRALPRCIDAAALRLSKREARSDTDTGTSYWDIAKGRASSASDAELVKLQKLTQQWLTDGMGAEQRGDKAAARRSYQIVRDLVPDIGCDANLLAASRIQVALAK